MKKNNRVADRDFVVKTAFDDMHLAHGGEQPPSSEIDEVNDDILPDGMHVVEIASTETGFFFREN